MNSFKTFLLLLAITCLFLICGELIAGKQGMIFAFFLALITNFFSYFFSDKVVLSMYKAKELPRNLNTDIYKVVDSLAVSANIPTPRVFYINSPVPNAFATGRDPNHSAIAITDGLFKLLSDEEIKGVISHEMSHIKNRDIAISCFAATIASAIVMLARFAFLFGGGKSRNNNNIVALLLMVILAPIAAAFIQMAISRSREYLADETGAKISKDPMSLANALRKLSSGNEKIKNNSVNPATAHMFIVTPFSSTNLQNLFSTHPPIEERIKRLEKMAQKVQDEKYKIPKVIY
jgi:heat shock protein HtpX